ncbi:protein-tyrosine-phosphatase [Urechidicola sp. KH5]
MFQTIKDTISHLDVAKVSNERKEVLQPLVNYIQEKKNNNVPIDINFICTHNSRRSHLSQVWAQVMAAHFNIKGVTCYSGGTEATALFPKVAETLSKQGFEIAALSELENPVYAIKYAENAHPIIGFSKRYDNAFNPTSKFAAIMTCSQADGGCPFVAGCDKRIAITFEDPKVSDGTPQQSKVYLERSVQIATELYFVFSQVK